MLTGSYRRRFVGFAHWTYEVTLRVDFQGVIQRAGEYTRLDFISVGQELMAFFRISRGRGRGWLARPSKIQVRVWQVKGVRSGFLHGCWSWPVDNGTPPLFLDVLRPCAIHFNDIASSFSRF